MEANTKGPKASPDNRFPNLPERIRGLGRLASNLWWSWHPRARDIFRSLDYQTWRKCERNPIRMLSLLPQEFLDRAAGDASFLDRYDAVMDRFEAEVTSRTGWFSAEYGSPSAPLAYFSPEYAFHSSLPLYAGGLGVLAGDYIKEASDLAIPIVAVGLIYSRGYVSQKIGDDGLQQDEGTTLDRTYDPIVRVRDERGEPLQVTVPLFDPPVHVAVWRADVGRVPVYLLDTDIEANQPWDRSIAHHLYATNPEQRLRQEIVLGIGGMRVLEALGIIPAAAHINEGHPALALLERLRLFVEKGSTFEEGLERVRATSVFTTHTPISAGTDVFPFALLEKYLGGCCHELGTDREHLLQLGVWPEDAGAGFNMTVFALHMARHCNAVSKKHGEVARKMWASLWPEKKPGEVPIVSITNGVHLPTWVDPIGLQSLFDRYLGPAWLEDQDRPGIWKLVDKIPDEKLWRLRLGLKVFLMDEINDRARLRWSKNRVHAENVIAFGALLDPEIFTIGFARRFTGYKRPDLILSDFERLKRLLNDPQRPAQIIFAGKAHPSDTEGKRLIQKVFRLARDPAFGARIAFVEGYDQQLALRMVQGVDIWLNNPRPPLEASGTSGMKAGVNGVPNLSILDGWWPEGYTGDNGWAFGGDPHASDPPAGDPSAVDRDKADADALYRLLEETVVPLYYRRDDDGIPHEFVQVMKASIKSVAPAFNTRRMAKQYVEQFYVGALGLRPAKG
jgi:starch phosphorylase